MKKAGNGCEYNCGDECNKECLPSKSKWLEMMDFLTINNEMYDDKEWAERFQLACNEIPANQEVTHQGCNAIIQTRVERYCNEKGISIKEYDGPMPFRLYTVDTKDL